MPIIIMFLSILGILGGAAYHGFTVAANRRPNKFVSFNGLFILLGTAFVVLIGFPAAGYGIALWVIGAFGTWMFLHYPISTWGKTELALVEWAAIGFVLQYASAFIGGGLLGLLKQPKQPSAEKVCKDDSSGKVCGTVGWFNGVKGYGFITPDGGGRDVFVHIAEVNRAGLATLEQGQRVRFLIETDRRTGKRAAAHLSRI